MNKFFLLCCLAGGDVVIREYPNAKRANKALASYIRRKDVGHSFKIVESESSYTAFVSYMEELEKEQLC